MEICLDPGNANYTCCSLVAVDDLVRSVPYCVLMNSQGLLLILFLLRNVGPLIANGIAHVLTPLIAGQSVYTSVNRLSLVD
jgi:hypothetical protein